VVENIIVKSSQRGNNASSFIGRSISHFKHIIKQGKDLVYTSLKNYES